MAMDPIDHERYDFVSSIHPAILISDSSLIQWVTELDRMPFAWVLSMVQNDDGLLVVKHFVVIVWSHFQEHRLVQRKMGCLVCYVNWLVFELVFQNRGTMLLILAVEVLNDFEIAVTDSVIVVVEVQFLIRGDSLALVDHSFDLSI